MMRCRDASSLTVDIRSLPRSSAILVRIPAAVMPCRTTERYPVHAAMMFRNGACKAGSIVQGGSAPSADAEAAADLALHASSNGTPSDVLFPRSAFHTRSRGILYRSSMAEYIASSLDGILCTGMSSRMRMRCRDASSFTIDMRFRSRISAIRVRLRRSSLPCRMLVRYEAQARMTRRNACGCNAVPKAGAMTSCRKSGIRPASRGIGASRARDIHSSAKVTPSEDVRPPIVFITRSSGMSCRLRLSISVLRSSERMAFTGMSPSMKIRCRDAVSFMVEIRFRIRISATISQLRRLVMPGCEDLR